MDPVRRARDLGRRYFDGLASQAERSELEQVLRESPAAADAFAHLSRLEADLSALFSEEPGRLREAELLQDIERDQRRRRWRGRGVRVAAAAALLMLLCGPLLWWLGQRSRPVAPPQANNTVLEGRVLVAGEAVEHLLDGAPLLVAGSAPALLQLSDGSRARLRPGSRAVLYGRSPGVVQRVELIEGEGRFMVQQGEEAFRVDTSLGWVTAPGAEFTVKLMKSDIGDPSMTMQRTLLAVIVFAGLVRVETEDGAQLLSVGESRVFGQERKPEPGGREGGRRPAIFRGTVVAVKDGKLIIAAGGGRDGAVREETLEVPATAKIFVDDKPAKLTDLVKRTMVMYTKDEQGAVTAVRASGPLVGGAVKSVADGKLTLAGLGRNAGDEKTYAVAKDVKVIIDRQPAKLADVKKGMLVALQLAVDGQTVRTITQVQPRGAGPSGASSRRSMSRPARSPSQPGGVGTTRRSPFPRKGR